MFEDDVAVEGAEATEQALNLLHAGGFIEFRGKGAKVLDVMTGFVCHTDFIQLLLDYYDLIVAVEALTGCSAVSYEIPRKAEPAPYISTSIPELKKAAAEAKLTQPLEVAGPIEANPISTARWIICLRSGATQESRRRSFPYFLKPKNTI